MGNEAGLLPDEYESPAATGTLLVTCSGGEVVPGDCKNGCLPGWGACEVGSTIC